MFAAGVIQDSTSFYALSLLLRVTGNSVLDAYQLSVRMWECSRSNKSVLKHN